MLLLDKELTKYEAKLEYEYGITETVNKIRIGLRPKRIHELDFDALQEKHEESIYESRKQLEPIVYNIIEHYQDSVFDICNVETSVMNWFWEGDEREHINGGRTVQDLRNRRLLNLLTRKLLDAIIVGDLTQYHINTFWNSKDREKSSSEKEYCWCCKKFTSQYENICAKCHGIPLLGKHVHKGDQ